MRKLNMANNEKHYIEYVLPFYMMLSQYKVGPVTLGTIALMFVAIIVLYNHQFKFLILEQFRPFFVFLAYVVLRDVFRMFLGTDPIQTQINRMIEYLLVYFLVFVVCSQSFDEEKLFKVYKVAASIYILGLIYHVFQLYVLGHGISPISIIPGYVLRSEEFVASTRPCSFFAEPASFATVMLPMLFISLRKQNVKWAVICTLSILLSTSTIGIILTVVLWCFAFLKRDVKKGTKVIMLIVCIMIIVVFANLNIFADSLGKLLQVTQGESTFGSRVECSFEVLKTMDIFSLFFGTNYNEVAGYLDVNYSKLSDLGEAALYYRSNGTVFLNTFAQIIFKYGIFGLAAYAIPFKKFMSDKNYVAKSFLIMIIIAIFGQTMLLNSYYFMVLMLIMLYAQVNENYFGDDNCSDM